MVRLPGVKLTRSEALVSIIVPARNNSDTIDRCLESLCAQTYKNIEILVWDDKSDDNTFEKARSFGDYRISAFRSREWGAPAYARNRLLDRASGDFIVWQDADDYSHPQRIEFQLAAMVATRAGVSRCAKQYFSKYVGIQKDVLLDVKISERCRGGTVPSTMVVSRPKVRLCEYMLTRHEYVWEHMVTSLFNVATLSQKLYFYSAEQRDGRFTANKHLFINDEYDFAVLRSALERFRAYGRRHIDLAREETDRALNKLRITYDGPAINMKAHSIWESVMSRSPEEDTSDLHMFQETK